jgi:hypothetical protein
MRLSQRSQVQGSKSRDNILIEENSGKFFDLSLLRHGIWSIA